MQNKLIIISFLCLVTFTAEGQKLVNSPYSRFNIGTLDPSGSFRGLSMGGIGIAMRDNNSIFINNPASYSSLDTTSFVFDFGMDFSINIISNGSKKYSSDDMNFDHMLIGFPLAKGWGFATGLVPVSNGYYNLSDEIKEGDPDYNSITGEVSYYHKGSGGLSNFFLGTGINVTRNFSVGANFTVLFGQLERTNQFEFSDFANTFSEMNSEKIRINGVNFDYGIQYIASFKDNYFVNAGFSLTASKKYHSSNEKLSERFTAYVAAPYSPDTLVYLNDNSNDSTKLPGTLRAGISFGKRDKFTAGIDYISTKWTDARIHGSQGYLADSKSLLFGVEYIPDKYSNVSYLSRVEYRLGGHISDNYLIINGVQIKEYGISCGFGFRLRNSLSKANLFFDYTRKNGEIARGLHNENYFTVGASINLYDFWFVKRKYD